MRHRCRQLAHKSASFREAPRFAEVYLLTYATERRHPCRDGYQETETWVWLGRYLSLFSVEFFALWLKTICCRCGMKRWLKRSGLQGVGRVFPIKAGKHEENIASPFHRIGSKQHVDLCGNTEVAFIFSREYLGSPAMKYASAELPRKETRTHKTLLTAIELI